MLFSRVQRIRINAEQIWKKKRVIINEFEQSQKLGHGYRYQAVSNPILKYVKLSSKERSRGYRYQAVALPPRPRRSAAQSAATRIHSITAGAGPSDREARPRARVCWSRHGRVLRAPSPCREIPRADPALLTEPPGRPRRRRPESGPARPGARARPAWMAARSRASLRCQPETRNSTF